MIDERMAQIHADFHRRPEPTDKKRQWSFTSIFHKISDYILFLELTRCRGDDDDDCPSYEQCELNAQAHDAANKYIMTQKKRGNEFYEQIYINDKLEKLKGRPTQRCHKNETEDKKHIKCAAMSANHRV